MNVPLNSIVSAWTSALSKPDFIQAVRELVAFSEALMHSRPVRMAMITPTLAFSKKDAVLVHVGMHKPVRDLVRYVDQHRLWNRLPELARAAQRLYHEQHAIKPVIVLSAVALTQAERTKLQRALEQRLKSTIELTEAVDPTLVGGLIVDMQGQRFDHSVRGKLNRLARAITSFV